MIVTKTPLRISLFGGGSDIPQYYNKHYGIVISTTIDKHIYISLNRCVADHLKVIYSELELSHNLENVKHDRVRESLRYFGINNNIELCSFSDVPTKGTGLGSSSTFTVGVLKALYNLQKKKYTKSDLAELACKIEIDMCKEPIGKQDQYAAVYGGFNVIRFYNDGVDVKPIQVDSDTIERLNKNLICYNTGISRKTSDILSVQISNLQTNKNNSALATTHKMVELAEASLNLLQNKKLDDFGKLLDETWQMKKSLASNISNNDIDKMYDIATSAGAYGGKILGAGGGGYMLLYVPDSKLDNVQNKMLDYKKFNFKFSDVGSKAISI